MARRTSLTAALVALALLGPVSACSDPPAAQSDAQKRARIAEMVAEYRRSFPDVPEVKPAELADPEARAAVVLVDAREPRERAVSTIPGAIGKDEPEADPERFAGRPIVTFCTIGYRSGLYARELRERGIDARILEGSILAWTHAGLPLVSADGPTRQVHVYGEKWNLAADGYEAVW